MAIVLFLHLGAGCGEEKAGGRSVEELETVEVGPAVDAELSTELDERADPDAPAVAGVLPSEFPSDFPLFAPSSLIDFGAATSGRRFVEFDAPADCREVSERLSLELAASGWRRAGSGQEGTSVLLKDERRVELWLLARPPGCGIRIEYRP